MSGSEFDLIYRYFSALGRGDAVELSVGDDCAILRLAAGERLATSVDTMVEGVHFPADSFPEVVGFRAVAAAASDLAAMGARPLGMTVALTLPQADDFWLNTFSQGLAQAVEQCDLPLVGGDMTRGPLTITVQVLGALPDKLALLRGGARVGERVYVSGTLGDAAAGLALVAGELLTPPAELEDADTLVARYERPRPRLALGRALLGRATSAIDVSDGLLADAGHIAAASGVRLVIDPQRLPLSAALLRAVDEERARTWALTGGDDYELCFTLPADEQPPADCTCIGRVEAGEGVDCGLAIDIPPGYQHF